MGVSGGYARQVDSFSDESLRGEWFATGRGPISVAGGASFRFLVVNPVGSGKLIMIHRYRAHVSSSGEFASILVNPTTNLPVVAVPSTNRMIGAPSGAAVITVDAGPAISGGTVLPYEIPLVSPGETYTEFIIHPMIILPPGFSIATNTVNATAGPSNMSALLDWREVPA